MLNQAHHRTGRGGAAQALARLTQPACVLGVDSDVLYPLTDQQRLHTMLPNASLHVIQSMHGHDGFLLEQSQIEPILLDFLRKQRSETTTRIKAAAPRL